MRETRFLGDIHLMAALALNASIGLDIRRKRA
jgi:hypothetical protein